MATPQELYDETKTQLMQPIMEDQGALKQLEKLNDVVQPVESK